MEQSQFRMYSIGIVVETKPVASDYILVTPMEELSIQDSGKIRDASFEFKGNKDTIGSRGFTTEHTSKNFVRAKWNSIGQGNRTTAPDVVAGETVILYKYGDVDEYFWDESGREPSLRRLENILYSFSNVPDGIGSKAYDEETSYWVKVNTKDKFVHIHTADNDGEACTWDIKIDTLKGLFTIDDGLGNYMHWDAPAGKHVSNFNSEILRMAPVITDISQFHTIKTDHYLNETSDDMVNTSTTMHSSASVNITEESPTIFNLAEKATSHFGPEDAIIKAVNIMLEAEEKMTSKAPTLEFISIKHIIETTHYLNNTAEDMINNSTTTVNTASVSILDSAPAVDIKSAGGEGSFGSEGVKMSGAAIVETSEDHTVETERYVSKASETMTNEAPIMKNDITEEIQIITPRIELETGLEPDPMDFDPEDPEMKVDFIDKVKVTVPEITVETPLIRLERGENEDPNDEETKVVIEALGNLEITSPQINLERGENEDPNDEETEVVLQVLGNLSVLTPKIKLSREEEELDNRIVELEVTEDLRIITPRIILEQHENVIWPDRKVTIEVQEKLKVISPEITFEPGDGNYTVTENGYESLVTFTVNDGLIIDTDKFEIGDEDNKTTFGKEKTEFGSEEITFKAERELTFGAGEMKFEAERGFKVEADTIDFNAVTSIKCDAPEVDCGEPPEDPPPGP